MEKFDELSKEMFNKMKSDENLKHVLDNFVDNITNIFDDYNYSDGDINHNLIKEYNPNYNFEEATKKLLEPGSFESLAKFIESNSDSIITEMKNLNNFLIKKKKKKKKEKNYMDKAQRKIMCKKVHENCPICIDEMKKVRNMYITKCNHIFHKKCWNMYKNKHECPYCRSEL